MSSSNTQKLTTQDLAAQLKLNPKQVIKIAADLGLDPDNLTESDGVAIANHLNGTTPIAIKGSKPRENPESFSIEDSEEFVNWGEVEEELGDGALALVAELGLEPEAITQSDLVALRELALSNPVHQNLVDHIGAVGSVQEGVVNEHIRSQYEAGGAIAEVGNTALMIGMLETQLKGLEQVYTLQSVINSDLQGVLNSHLEKLGKHNQGTPDKTVQDLGKKATQNQQNSQKSSTIRTQKLDVIAIKNSLQN